jgi:hypothetical protein
MKEDTLDTSQEIPTPAEAPHFDDELTVLTAQPVVPLETIDAKQRNRRYWFLAAAFAIAMMLGSGSALLASYLKLRNVTNVTEAASNQTSVVETEPQPVAAAEPVPSDSPVVEAVEEESPDPEPPKTEPVVKRRNVVARKPDPEPDERPNLSEDEELNRVRDAVLFDEWQERRARRVNRRERRRAHRADRDLSNLDEIFEGRRRRP